MRLFFAETGIVLQLGFSQVVGHKIKQTYGITKKKRAGAVISHPPWCALRRVVFPSFSPECDFILYLTSLSLVFTAVFI